MEMRPPSLSRIFDRKLFGYVLKHVVEPYAVFRYETGVNNFANIIRFDYRDILANSSSMEYGVVNRLYAKKSKSNSECYLKPKYLPSGTPPAEAEKKLASDKTICDDNAGAAREVFTFTIAQKYFFNPTFGGALVPNQRNVFDSSVDFSGIAFLTQPRNASPIITRTLYSYGGTSIQWDMDYDPVFNQVNCQHDFPGPAPVRQNGTYSAAKPICTYPAKSYRRTPARSWRPTSPTSFAYSLPTEASPHAASAAQPPLDTTCGTTTCKALPSRAPTTGIAAASPSNTPAGRWARCAMKTPTASPSASATSGPSAI